MSHYLRFTWLDSQKAANEFHKNTANWSLEQLKYELHHFCNKGCFVLERNDMEAADSSTKFNHDIASLRIFLRHGLIRFMVRHPRRFENRNPMVSISPDLVTFTWFLTRWNFWHACAPQMFKTLFSCIWTCCLTFLLKATTHLPSDICWKFWHVLWHAFRSLHNCQLLTSMFSSYLGLHCGTFFVLC